MPVPDYQSMMLPALQVLGRQSPRTLAEIRAELATEFELLESDLRELLPSGRRTIFADRVNWACTYLKRAMLITSPQRGVYDITDRGREALRDEPPRIDNKYLSRYPEFQAFLEPPTTRDVPIAPVHAENAPDLTPDEQIRFGYKQLRETLVDRLLERVKSVSPAGFEQLVIDVLVGLGYGGSRTDAGRVVGGTGDGGIDGTIEEDRLGLDVIYVQAKRWQNTVGRPEIQRFAGALQGQRARKGIFITTSTFTDEAIGYVDNLQVSIVLIDGRRLAELMIDAQIGVSPTEAITILRQDEDYFEALDEN